MSSTILFAILITLALSFISSTNSHVLPCTNLFSQLGTKRNYSNCRKLTTLDVEFGWSVNSISKHNDSFQIQIIIGVKVHEGMRWLAWGVNPRMPQMVGTRAIIGIMHPNSTISVNTYNITSDTKLGCRLIPSPVDPVEFKNFSAKHNGNYFILQSTVVLPEPDYNISRLNHVWQVGHVAEGLEPKMHGKTLQNFDSVETANLNVFWDVHHFGQHKYQTRLVHGVLNVMGWGIFLPAGAIIARYSNWPLGFKYERWLPFHIGCQITGYFLGIVGWIIGLYLGSHSKYYAFHTHRLYSIFIFTFTTLQMFALRFKPESYDKYRDYWNMYHHFLGYGLIAVISINIFHGIGIFKPDRSWEWAYIGILVLFGVVVIGLEIYTWVLFCCQPKSTPTTESQRGSQNIHPVTTDSKPFASTQQPLPRTPAQQASTSS